MHEDSDAEEKIKKAKPFNEKLSIPFQEGLNLIAKGGRVKNENGLIYTLMFNSDLEI